MFLSLKGREVYLADIGYAWEGSENIVENIKHMCLGVCLQGCLLSFDK